MGRKVLFFFVTLILVFAMVTPLAILLTVVLESWSFGLGVYVGAASGVVGSYVGEWRAERS